MILKTLKKFVPLSFLLFLSIQESQAEPIRILLLGETGAGKSTFLQTLFNSIKNHDYDNIRFLHPVSHPENENVIYPPEEETEFGDVCPHREASSILFSETELAKIHDEGVINDQTQSQTGSLIEYSFNSDSAKKFEIIDSPGFSSTEGENADDKIYEAIDEYLAENQVHYIVIIVNNTVKRGKSVTSTIEKLQKFFGNDNREDLEDHCVVIGSHTKTKNITNILLKEKFQKLNIFKEIDHVKFCCVDSKCLFHQIPDPEYDCDSDDDVNGIPRWLKCAKKDYGTSKEGLRSIFCEKIPKPLESETFKQRIKNKEEEQREREQNLTELEGKVYKIKSLRGDLNRLNQDLKDRIADKISKENEVNRYREIEVASGKFENTPCVHKEATIRFVADHFQRKDKTNISVVYKECDKCRGSGKITETQKVVVTTNKPFSKMSGRNHLNLAVRGKIPTINTTQTISKEVTCPKCQGAKKIPTDKTTCDFVDIYSPETHKGFPKQYNISHQHVVNSQTIKVKSNCQHDRCPQHDEGIDEHELCTLLKSQTDGTLSGDLKAFFEPDGNKCKFCSKAIRPDSISVEFDVKNVLMQHSLKKDPEGEANAKNQADSLDKELESLSVNIQNIEAEISEKNAELSKTKGTIREHVNFYGCDSIDGSERPNWTECGISNETQRYVNFEVLNN